MTVIQLKTFNPLVLVEVIQGGIDSDNFAKRILKITYTDRDKNYDHIELEMDNSDGVLTRPETIAAGILIRIKMGYIDGVFPWKAFVVNRMRGGPGVYGYKNPSVGENERRLTLYGRNRNAPGGRPSRRWRRGQAAAPSTGRTKGGKARKVYPPTKDITKFETLLSGEKDKDARVIKCTSTSDGVRKIMQRHGFSGANALIQPTYDYCESLIIPQGVPDGVFVEDLGEKYDFVTKVEDNTFRWHSRTWGGAKYQFAPALRYGGGPDILTFSMDADFRLPIPSITKTKAYNDTLRTMISGDIRGDAAVKKVKLGIVYSKAMQDPSSSKTLTRTDIIPVLADTVTVATAKAQSSFLKRHMRAFQILLRCTGNPYLLAARLLPLSGFGNPIFDRVWYISEARHINDSITYITELKLKQPPRSASVNGNIVLGLSEDRRGDEAVKQVKIGSVYVQTVKRTQAARR